MLNNLLATGNSGRDGQLSRPKRFSLTRGQSRPDNALPSTPRAIPASIGALIFHLETVGHAVWQEIFSPDDLLHCFKFDIMKRSLSLLIASVAGVLICVVLPGTNLLHSNPGSISIAFSGFTNDPAGAALAEFTFSNGYSGRMGFAAANVQIRQADGWPKSWILTNGPDYDVRPGMIQKFSVLLPDVEGEVWRVPIIYDKVGTKLDSWIYQGKSIAGVPHVARPSSTNTAEMIGLPNQTGAANRSKPVGSQTNRTPAAAGSGR
jgi:hypothetical protein